MKNKIVVHKFFGKGIIAEIIDSYIFIIFNDVKKQFKFPDVFLSSIVTTNDSELIQYINDFLITKNDKSVVETKEIEEPMQIHTDYYQKQLNRTNVAFKCNFCDGGSTEEQIGFAGICSNEIINWNINEAKHVWCSNEKCACNKYMNGYLSEKDLREGNIGTKSGVVCYESRMLIDWKASAGVRRSGERKGEPMTLKNVDRLSLCFLTSREKNQEEKDRYIFGIFLIDKVFVGDEDRPGYVVADPKYKIKFSPEETKKLLFWKYHANQNNRSAALWNTGLHRYLQNDVAATILKDIVKIKKGTKDEELAKEFLDYFCEINSLDINNIKKPNGCLVSVQF